MSRILFGLLFFALAAFQSSANACDQSNPRYLLRGDLNAQGKGARLWSLENLVQDLRNNPDDACAKQTFERAYSEQKEYWDDVKSRSGCPERTQVRVSCEEINLNLNFAESMNAAKERALGMPLLSDSGGCGTGANSPGTCESLRRPAPVLTSSDPKAACEEALEKRFGPSHPYSLDPNPGLGAGFLSDLGEGANACVKGLFEGVARTITSTINGLKDTAIGLFDRSSDIAGYLLYRAVDWGARLVERAKGEEPSSVEPLPITETLFAQDIHAIINFEFQDPETGTTYTGAEAMARAVTYGIKTYLKDSGTIYNCLDSASRTRFLCDAIAGIGTSFVGIRAIAQFGSRMASWTRAGSTGPKPGAPAELKSRIPQVVVQAREGEVIPGRRSSRIAQQPREGVEIEGVEYRDVTSSRLRELPSSANSSSRSSPTPSKGASAPQPVHSAGVAIEPSVGRALLRSARTEASNSRHLTALERNDLFPKSTLEVAGTKYHFSDIVEMGERKLVFAVIERNGERTTQTFYTSNSQGTFRNLPGVGTENGRVVWYDKGPGEGALELPAEVEAALANRIAAGQVRRDLSDYEVSGLFHGGVPKFNYDRGTHESEYIKHARSSPAHQVRLERIIVTPKSEKGLRSGSGHIFSPPGQIQFKNSGDSPDFKRAPSLKYIAHTATAGRVEAEVYRSVNGKYQYTIFRDSENKIWFAKAENLQAEIGITGLRTRAPEVGELTMPRWEYSSQVPLDYIGKINPLDSNYVDNWSYLREIPAIQSYYRSKGLEIP
jgi:hypothetical protein